MKLDTQVIAYAANVTEVEFGWGSRPDGYVLAISRDILDTERDRVSNISANEYGYDIVESNTFAFTPNQKAIELLEKSDKGFIYVGRDFSAYGERV